MLSMKFLKKAIAVWLMVENLWVVIQKKQGAPSAMDKIEQLFGNIEVR